MPIALFVASAARLLPPQLAVGSEQPVMLTLHALCLSMADNYHTLLHEFVFTQPATDGSDSKTEISYQTALDNEDALKVLQVLWRESDYVSPANLRLAFNGKKLGRRITAHGLAVDLCYGKQDVAAANTRIRLIGLAGAAYGLIERRPVSKTSVSLHGTEFLHQFMTKLGELHLQSLQELGEHFLPFLLGKPGKADR